MTLQVGAHAVQLLVAASQHHDVALAVSLLRHQPHDGLAYLLIDGVGVASVDEDHAHMPLDGATRRQALPQFGMSVGVGGANIYPLRHRVAGKRLALQEPREERIVEIHDARRGAVVGVQGHKTVVALGGQRLAMERRHALHLRQRHKLAHVALTETVDGLLAVAHHQRLVALADAVLQQRHQVVPLQHRRVLELVNQEVVVAVAQALVDERRGLVAHNTINQTVEFREMHHLVLLAVEVELMLQLAQQGQRIEVLQQQRAGVVVAQGSALVGRPSVGHPQQGTGLLIERTELVHQVADDVHRRLRTFGAVQLAALEGVGHRGRQGTHVARRQTAEETIVAVAPAGAVGLFHPRAGQQLHHCLAAGGSLALKLAVVGRHRTLQRDETVEVHVLQLRQIFVGAFFEKLLRQPRELTLDVVALRLLHTALGIGAQHTCKLVVLRRPHQRHQLRHRLLYHLVLLNLHFEVDRTVQVVGEGAHDAVHETVDGAHRQVAVLMQDGRIDHLCHPAQLAFVQRVVPVDRHRVQRLEQRGTHA